MSLDLEIVSDIATELAVDPAFIEKDWYSIQVLSAIANFESTEITTIFSGEQVYRKVLICSNDFLKTWTFDAVINLKDQVVDNVKPDQHIESKLLEKLKALRRSMKMNTSILLKQCLMRMMRKILVLK